MTLLHVKESITVKHPRTNMSAGRQGLVLNGRVLALGLFTTALGDMLPFFWWASRIAISENFGNVVMVMSIGLVIFGVICSSTDFGRKGFVSEDRANGFMAGSFLIGGIPLVLIMVTAGPFAESGSIWPWIWLTSLIAPGVAFVRAWSLVSKHEL